jgi:acetyl esterase/lipase
MGVVKHVETYKTIGDIQLKIHIYEKEGRDRSKPAPAIVFFFGGGWVGGSPGQFFHHCDHLASEGMVAMSAEYRIFSKHKTSPFECVQDGKSAIRWVRANAKRLGIDPDRIAAGGGSAGGHVGACTGVIEGHEEPGEDTALSSVPNAMVLFNPVIDTTEKGYGAKKVKGRETEISPCHHVRANLPPTLIFHGTKDTTVPFENVERFQRLMKEAGNECEVMPFEGKAHGFFNFGRDPDNASYLATIKRMDEFLTKLKFLP